MRLALQLIALIATSLPAAAQDRDCAAALAALDAYRAADDIPLIAPSAVTQDDEWCLASGLHLDWQNGKWPQNITLDKARWQSLGPNTIRIEGDDLRLHLRNGPAITDLDFGGFLANTGAQVEAEYTYDPVTRRLTIAQVAAALPGNTSLFLSGELTGVDIGSRAGLQASLGSGRVTQAAVHLWMEAGFERAVIRPLITDPDGFSDGLADLRKLLAMLPPTVLSDASQQATRAFLDDLPAPKGHLSVLLQSDAGFGAASLMPIILRGIPQTPQAWKAALADLTLTVEYDTSAGRN
jgi:hypothetical protein